MLVSEDQDTTMSECPAQLLNDMVMPGPELQLRAMSGSMAPLQPGSVLMFNALAISKSRADSQDQGPS